ncbi:MAG: ATP-binding cassette domain-containing protein [Acidobacteria bacterium]|nr:ATP-binding cassette domain-containing protein [Acidobacteriota bacterium]
MSLKLVIEGLAKSYRRREIIRDISLHIESGEIVGLLGPNGAGKTTTFYCVVGLVRPDAGRVLLGGQDVSRLPMYLRARSGISYLPQEPSIFRKMTVEENLIAILETLDMPREEIRQRTATVLEEMKIAHLARNHAYNLSGGERRRAALLRALAVRPEVVILDEPTASLDRATALPVVETLLRARRRHDIAYLLITHDLELATAVADRIVRIEGGRESSAEPGEPTREESNGL